MDHDVIEALDVDPGAATRRATGTRHARDGGGHLLGVAAAAQFAVEALDDRERRDLPAVDRHEERVEVLEVRSPRSPRRAHSKRATWRSGRPSRRSALVSSSRPPSMASSRRSRWNHWRILDLAREDWAMASQSREGPAPSLLVVTISTTSAERNTVSSGTRRPLTFAPTQW